MLIRPETRADAEAVRRVHVRAFGRETEARLVDLLRRDGDLVAQLCHVVEVDGLVVGHAAVSRAVPDGLVALAPLAVLPDHRRQGLGSGLVHSVVAAAEALWYVGVVLLGDRRCHGRFGFTPADDHGLVPQPDLPTSALLVRPLPSSWRGGYPEGTIVRCPSAFGSLT